MTLDCFLRINNLMSLLFYLQDEMTVLKVLKVKGGYVHEIRI